MTYRHILPYSRFFLLITFLLFNCYAFSQTPVSIAENDKRVVIQNGFNTLNFDLKKGLFFILNDKGEKIIDYAYFQAGGLESKDASEKISWSGENIQDSVGRGKSLNIKVSFKNYADILWQVKMYEGKEFILFNMGINNDVNTPYRLMSFYPLVSNQMYKGKDNNLNFATLDGNAGGAPTEVRKDVKLKSFNNLLVKFGEPTNPQIFVAGGLTYNYFEKFVEIKKNDKSIDLKLYSYDPVGKLIDPGKKYWLNEQFYLCFINKNPFEALEKYASTLKKMQHIHLNYYDFPTECLWYAAFYNIKKGREKYNNSKGAVEEMDHAIASGFTKYSKVAIRLVPDAYTANNQQGWWDDTHWAMYNEQMSTNANHYTAPYLTTASWTQPILTKGGYPFTYFQSGRRSEDLVKEHPDWMLFNNPYRVVTNPKHFADDLPYVTTDFGYHWWTDKVLYGYDFTDPGFIKHMQGVYAHLKEAGIKGIFYDYPEETAWAMEGGFEDKYATTASAYRNMFKLAYEGLGHDAYLQERNIIRGSDIALGLVSSQRVVWDTDGITPEVVSRCGLRWYKNRVVINYDMDSKDPSDALPRAHHDGVRSMLTMCYVTSGRFLLGRSFSELSKDQLYDLSRIFPYHSSPQSARPIDAFDEGVKFPRVYSFEVSPSWQQLTFYNADTKALSHLSVSLSKSLNEGGLGLKADKSYYVYDFWNDQFVGLKKGSDKLEQELRAGEARMLSIHEKEAHPQFISTNRHIMQGFVDLKGLKWDQGAGTLSGTAEAVKDEPYVIVLAKNGAEVKNLKIVEGKASIAKEDMGKDLVKIIITNQGEQPDIKWKVSF